MENQLEEIDLLEHFKILKKKKKIIVSLFFVGIVAGFVWFFLVPSDYIGTIVIEIGQIDSDNVFEKSHQVADKIKIISFPSGVSVTTKSSSATALVEVSLSGKDYNNIDSSLKEIETNIIEPHSAMYENELSYLDEKYELLEKEKENLEKDISYFMARGQQAADLKLEMYKIQNNLDDIKIKKDKIRETKVIAGPQIERKKPSYLIIIFISLLGLFLGIVFAFALEYWNKNKSMLK